MMKYLHEKEIREPEVQARKEHRRQNRLQHQRLSNSRNQVGTPTSTNTDY